MPPPKDPTARALYLQRRSEALRGRKQRPEWIAKRIQAMQSTKRSRSLPLRERLDAQVERTSSCWLWRGAVGRCGYGIMCDRIRTNRNILVHRLAWELAHGSIPPGLMVCHRCDMKLCVNPDHLFLGTAKDNNNDAFNKGRNLTVGARRRIANVGKS